MSKKLVRAALLFLGAHVWSQLLGGEGIQSGLNVAVGPDGSIVLQGYFDGTIKLGGQEHPTGGTTSGFLVKLDPKGVALWSRAFLLPGNDFVDRLAVDGAGNVILGGMLVESEDLGGGALVSAGGKDVYFTKYSPSGEYILGKRFGDGEDQLGMHLAVRSDGGILVAGVFGGTLEIGDSPLVSPSGYDPFIAAFAP